MIWRNMKLSRHRAFKPPFQLLHRILTAQFSEWETWVGKVYMALTAVRVTVATV
jgi:hypothetical protein